MKCPNCGKELASSRLNKSPYLVVKEDLTQNEYENGMFAQFGMNKYGKIKPTNAKFFAKELGNLGLDIKSISLTALFLHELPDNKKGKEAKANWQACYDFSVSQLISVAKEKKVVLLCGAEVTRLFTGYGIQEICGLVTKSSLFPDVTVVIAAPKIDNMSIVPIGEMRFALKTFNEEVRTYERYRKV